MVSVFNILLTIVAVALFVPCGVFFLECMIALLAPRHRRRIDPAAPRPSLAILMPAHNEQRVIETTIRALLPQLSPGDRLVVVADNCTDLTAELADDAGAEVIERFDSQRRGKGYALGFGVRHLEKTTPPQVLVIIDADCIVEPGSLTILARQAMSYRCPVQAMYLMKPPGDASPVGALSTLAFTIRNEARPLGAAAMGGPCHLMGTGMALPWSLASTIRWDTGDIVEDMALGLDLALAGKPPLFCPEARVYGFMPHQSSAATSQRTRWEHGHLQTLISRVPSLVRAAWRQRRRDLLDLVLDLLVPPLALLVMLTSTALLAAVVAGLLGAWWYPAVILGIGLAMVGLAVIGCWSRFARHEVPLTGLLAAPLYLMWKVPIYAAFLFKRQTAWIRTAR